MEALFIHGFYLCSDLSFGKIENGQVKSYVHLKILWKLLP